MEVSLPVGVLLSCFELGDKDLGLLYVLGSGNVLTGRILWYK